jgi:hypothetical protein
MVSLMKIVSTPLQGDHQLAFRVALARSQLEVDLLPTFGTVMQLEKVIKSELQVMTRPEVKQEEVTPKIQTFQPQARPFHGGGKSGQGKGKHEEKKEGDGEKDAGKGKGKGRTPCRYYESDEGCLKGGECTFGHAVLGPTVKDRCWNCGGKGHRSWECVRPRKKAATTSSTRTSPWSTPKKEEGTTSSSNTPGPQVRNMNVPQVPEFPKEGEPKKENEPDPEGQEELTAKIKKLVGNPIVNQSRKELLEAIEKLQKEVKLKMIRIKKFEAKGEDRGVLDSGATHAVRPIEKDDEGLKEIKVELAGNVVTTMLMNNANTVLGPEGTQLIVPLIPIMKQLGCTLSTNVYGGMQLMHPSIGVLPIDDSTGTPLLPGKMCQHLI